MLYVTEELSCEAHTSLFDHKLLLEVPYAASFNGMKWVPDDFSTKLMDSFQYLVLNGVVHLLVMRWEMQLQVRLPE